MPGPAAHRFVIMRFSSGAQQLAISIGLICFIPIGFNMMMRNLLNEEAAIDGATPSRLSLKIPGDLVKRRLEVDFTIQAVNEPQVAVDFNNGTLQPAQYRFLAEAAKNNRVYGSKGVGAFFWLAGLQSIDYPFACKCDSVDLANFTPDESSTEPLVSKVKCSGVQPGMFSSAPVCDATNSASSISLVPVLLAMLVGMSFCHI